MAEPAPDVLGDDRPRRTVPVVLTVAALAAATVVVIVLDRGAAQDERDREATLARVTVAADVDLRETGGPRLSSRSTLLTLDLELRNDGPLPVRVDRAVVGGFRFLGDLDLDPGESALAQLVRTVTCPPGGAEPPLDPLPAGLRVEVLTSAGPRSVLAGPPGALPLERLRTSARRACDDLRREDAPPGP